MSETVDFDGAARELGQRILERAKAQVGAEWEALGEEFRSGLGRTAIRLARLQFDMLRDGHDLAHEIAHAAAQLANYTSVAEQRARTALLSAIGSAFDLAGALLARMARSAVREAFLG